MQAIISVRGLSISKTYKYVLTRRLAKLEPMFPNIIEAKIVLSKEKHRRTAALTRVARRHTFRSEETADDLEAAVDTAIAALGRQVRETKDRLKNRKARHAPRRVPAAPGPAADAPDVVVADAGYWHLEQMNDITGQGIPVLIPPDSSRRKSARPGWNGGAYDFMRGVLQT